MFSARWACVPRVAFAPLEPVKHDPCDKVFTEIFEPVFNARRHKKSIALGGPEPLLFDDKFSAPALHKVQLVLRVHGLQVTSAFEIPGAKTSTVIVPPAIMARKGAPSGQMSVGAAGSCMSA